MSLDKSHTLPEVFCLVVEELAFMFGEPVTPDELPDAVDDATLASITFHGPMTGELIMIGPRGLAFMMAANILGLDDVTDVDQAIDAMGEALNVCCGQVLTAAFGDELVFDLTPPQVGPAQHDQWQNLKTDANAFAFMVDDMPIMLRLQVDQGEEACTTS